jgi:large subunit ribosomal protein L22
MEAKAKLRYLRMSPKKVRVVAKEIKNKNVNFALTKLKFISRAAALPISKVLKSAVDNAVKNFGVDADKLFVKDIIVDAGPILKYAKRFIPRAFGRASQIHKRTSHVTVIVTDKKE